MKRLLCSLLVLFATAPPAAAREAPAAVPITRWALVVGANDGGTDRPRLRFAGADARAFAEVMTRFGGLERQRVVLLDEPGPAALEAAFRDLGGRIGATPAASGRVEVLFYYSGHSDERGLLLGGQRVGYADLRRAIETLPAQVRIAVIDSCASGAMIRAKGGERRPAFLVDQSNEVRGTALLASASADEAAQESDRVGASFFSHALVTGLRGAADVSGDDRVTLNEAYQFAFAETLGRTQQSALGPQHASYDIQLVGQGDVVLTDLSNASARLLLDEALDGRIYVRDRDGALVAELRKPAGRVVQLGLAAGEYEVLLDGRSEKRLGRVSLNDQAPTLLRPSQLAPVDAEVARARGDVGAPAPADAAWGFSVVPGLATDQEGSRRFSLGLFGAAPRRVDVVGASSLFNVVTEDNTGFLGAGLFNLTLGRSEGVTASGLFNYAGAGGAGLQYAGVVNVARHEHQGVQLSVLNIGGDVTGVQGGVINIAGNVRGAQLGVINVARTVEGASLGLIPVVVDGRHHLVVHGGEVVHAAAAYKIGASHTHAMFGLGTRFAGEERLVPMLGLGAHLPIPTGYVDLDLLTHALLGGEGWTSREPAQLHTLRIVYGYQVAARFAVFAGPTWNALTSDADREAPDLGFTPVLSHRGDSTRVQQWPGAVAGVQL